MNHTKKLTCKITQRKNKNDINLPQILIPPFYALGNICKTFVINNEIVGCKSQPTLKKKSQF